MEVPILWINPSYPYEWRDFSKTAELLAYLEKQTMASLQGLMSETAKVELERLPSYIQECSMLYMPHLGYLLGVKVWAEDLTPEDKDLPNMKFMVSLAIANYRSKAYEYWIYTTFLTFQFQNNDYIHYKSKGCEGKIRSNRCQTLMANFLNPVSYNLGTVEVYEEWYIFKL